MLRRRVGEQARRRASSLVRSEIPLRDAPSRACVARPPLSITFEAAPSDCDIRDISWASRISRARAGCVAQRVHVHSASLSSTTLERCSHKVTTTVTQATCRSRDEARPRAHISMTSPHPLWWRKTTKKENRKLKLSLREVFEAEVCLIVSSERVRSASRGQARGRASVACTVNTIYRVYSCNRSCTLTAMGGGWRPGGP